MRQHRIAGNNLKIDRLQLNGPFFSPSRWQYHLQGRLDRGQLTTDKIPDVLHFHDVNFETDEKSLKVHRAGLTALDTHLTISGRTTFRRGRFRSAVVKFQGTIGHRADKWINDLFAAESDYLLVQTPVAVKAATIKWAADKPVAITADLTTSKGVQVILSQEWQRNLFRKERIQIHDGAHRATISSDRRPDQVAGIRNTCPGKIRSGSESIGVLASKISG